MLSAVEGLKLDAPQLAPAVVPISIAILVGVFLVQRKGTAFIGNIFWPVMLTWFIAIGLLGLRGIVGAPGILSALSPHHALIYLLHAGPGICFAVLGAAFLALTGAEAMYADMGHFGRLPIQRPVRCSARLVADSPLEESGFEPSVPLLRKGLQGVAEGRSRNDWLGSRIKLWSSREMAIGCAPSPRPRTRRD